MSDVSQPSLEQTELPVCPHCGHEWSSDEEADFCSMDVEEEVTCEECDKVYVISVFVSYRYTTRKVEP